MPARRCRFRSNQVQRDPLDDRGAERLEPSLAGRPTLFRGNSQLFFPGMGRLSENSVVSIKNKSFSVTADVETADDEPSGVIIAQGGRLGGWALYAKGGKAKFVYNVLGIHQFPVEADPEERLRIAMARQ